ncbi:MAG: glycoside hydrolase family 3 C-terminal domain-containing protein [Acidobacteriaceae bacterium]
MKTIRAVLIVVLFATLGPLLSAQFKYPFQNNSLTTDQRIDNVLSLLTLQEKIDLLGKNLNVPRLGIYGSGKIDSAPGSSGQFEGLHGIAMGGIGWAGHSPGPPGKWGGKSVIPTTQFPQPVGLGETWDPNLIQKAAAQEGYEARYIFQSLDRGGLIVRAPNADLARDPRWGRGEESYGEDPYLTGTMSVAFVKGLQGDNPRYWLTASLVKHFLANSNEDGRTGSSSNFDSRLLHEYYAVPFRMAIEQGHADAYMAAFNAVNGIPMTASPLLKSLTMDKWGFHGMIDTDRDALSFMVNDHHYYPNTVKAAAGAIHAGINQFLSSYQTDVKSALQQKLITDADIDQNLRGVLRVMIRLGFMDPPALVPYTQINAAHVPVPWEQEVSKRLVLHVTQESIVLLKNTKHLLPLNRSALKSIAVIGPQANKVYLDRYSGTPPFTVTPLQGIQSKVNSKVDVRYSAGGSDAVRLARISDVAIVFVGNRPACNKRTDTLPCPNASEGMETIDRKQIDLMPEQDKLIREVYAANPRTIVVLVSSFPYTIDWEKQHIPAILHMANNSEEEGNALADVLFGDYNPAGRLVMTWPKSITQLPPMMDYNIRDGRTYMYFHGKPLFSFGYGLSYTKFAYSKLLTSSSRLSKGKQIEVSLQVTNTGKRSGDEVVQMYVKHIHSKVERPALELKGFQRVYVPAGQTIVVKLPLTAKSLMYWSAPQAKWSLENDKVEIMIGSSSRDIKLSKVIDVDSPVKK